MSKQRRARAVKRLLRAIKPTVAAESISRKRLMVEFAERNGLVYFGYVNQRTDEHKLVRGMTASPTHRDSHYCIGSVDGYDVVLVERRTEESFPGKPLHATTWMIAAIDLKRRRDIPHTFFDSGPRNETFYANLFTKFSKLRQIDFTSTLPPDSAFAKHYKVFAQSDRILDVEQLFTQEVTEAMGKHFSPLDVEVEGDMIYLYADNFTLTAELLDAMLKNGLWLAARLDESNEAA